MTIKCKKNNLLFKKNFKMYILIVDGILKD